MTMITITIMVPIAIATIIGTEGLTASKAKHTAEKKPANGGLCISGYFDSSSRTIGKKLTACSLRP